MNLTALPENKLQPIMIRDSSVSRRLRLYKIEKLGEDGIIVGWWLLVPADTNPSDESRWCEG